jgi:molybdate transport system permease protein
MDSTADFAGIPAELWRALWLTLRLATVSTVLLLMLTLPLAGWINRSRSRAAPMIEAIASLPMVLPPTVIGFYLLIAFGNHSPLGRAWLWMFGQSLAFTFSGLVIGSVLYSLPYALQPIQLALRELDAALIEAAVALGANRRKVFWQVMVPAARSGILAGGALSFAHTIGEFGVVLMLGGNIPGVTRVASIALYDETQNLNYTVAHRYALLLLMISFAMLLLIAGFRRQSQAAARPLLS